MGAVTLLLSPPSFSQRPLSPTTSSFFHSPPTLVFSPLKLKPFLNPLCPLRNNSVVVRADDGDADGGGPDDYEMDDEELEEVDNKKDFDIEYDPTAAASTSVVVGADEDISMVQSKSFVSTQGWDSEMVVDYRINEDEFHKISLFHCDFFIRKPPDPDNDVYDFREVPHFYLIFLLNILFHNLSVLTIFGYYVDVCYSSGHRCLCNSKGSCSNASEGTFPFY